MIRALGELNDQNKVEKYLKENVLISYEQLIENEPSKVFEVRFANQSSASKAFITLQSKLIGSSDFQVEG